MRYPSGKHSLYSCFLLRCLQGVDKLVTRPGDNVTIAGDDSAAGAAAAYSSQLEVSQDGKLPASDCSRPGPVPDHSDISQ